MYSSVQNARPASLPASGQRSAGSAPIDSSIPGGGVPAARLSPSPIRSRAGMPTVVMKFGGTSVGSVERLESVADRVVHAREAGNGVIVVVSAMGTTTDDLLAMATDMTDLA